MKMNTVWCVISHHQPIGTCSSLRPYADIVLRASIDVDDAMGNLLISKFIAPSRHGESSIQISWYNPHMGEIYLIDPFLGFQRE